MNKEHIEIAKKLYLNNPEKYIEQLKKDFGPEVSSLVLEILDKNDVEILRCLTVQQSVFPEKMPHCLLD